MKENKFTSLALRVLLGKPTKAELLKLARETRADKKRRRAFVNYAVSLHAMACEAAVKKGIVKELTTPMPEHIRLKLLENLRASRSSVGQQRPGHAGTLS